MTKLSGPLLSQTARGSLGPRLTYSTRSSGSQVRVQRAQKDVKTSAQIAQRDIFTMAVSWWHMLTTGEQDEWAWEGNNP